MFNALTDMIKISKFKPTTNFKILFGSYFTLCHNGCFPRLVFTNISEFIMLHYRIRSYTEYFYV